MSKLRLIHSATKVHGAYRPSPVRRQLTDAEFARKLLTDNHGPACAAYLARKFKRAIKARGFFVTRIPTGEIVPMWYSLAIALFKERTARWDVREFERSGARLWKITYLRHGTHARRGNHLRLV